jgi:phospholipid transport system transporter-binding protein
MSNTWKIDGTLCIQTVAEMEIKGRQMIDAAPQELNVDLSGVSKSDSTGVALLIAWLRYARQNQKRIIFQNLPEKMMDNVRVSGLEAVLALK